MVFAGSANSRRDRETVSRRGGSAGKAKVSRSRGSGKGERPHFRLGSRSRALGARVRGGTRRARRGSEPAARRATRRRGEKVKPESPAHRRRPCAAAATRVSGAREEARKAASARASRGRPRGDLRPAIERSRGPSRVSPRASAARALDRLRATARPPGRDLGSEAPTAGSGALGRGAWTHLRVRVFAVWLTPVDLSMQERRLRAHLQPRVRVRAPVCPPRAVAGARQRRRASRGRLNAPPRKRREGEGLSALAFGRELDELWSQRCSLE